MEDEEIVKLYLKKDSAAVSESKSKYGERLRKISYGITLDHGSAEEVENDTYFKAWENIPPHEPYTYLFAFLARIARNLSLQRKKPPEAYLPCRRINAGNGGVHSLQYPC